MEALVKRNGKRAASRAASKNDDAKAILKKPSAAPAFKVPVTWDPKTTQSRQCWTSSWSHKARKEAKATGLDDEDAMSIIN